MPRMAKLFRSGTASVLTLAMAMAVGSAVAADDKKEGKDQVKRLQQKTNALQQDKSRLEGQLRQATEQLDQARQSAEAANRKGGSLGKALKTTEREKTELSEKLAMAEQKLAETAATLLQTQDAKNQLEASLSTRTQEFAVCATKNESLHRLGVDLIRQYEEKSCLSSLLQKEPLTQLKSAAIENRLEEYREMLDEELVNQQQAASLKPVQQATDAPNVEQQQADAAKVEQREAEQKKAESMKAGQQSNLDRISRKVKKFFEDAEW